MNFLFLLSLLTIPAAQAGILDLSPGEKSLEGVNLASKAKLETEGRKFTLSPVGAGLRYKKVVFVKANVYVGQLFLPEGAKFERSLEGALSSVAAAQAVAMQLTFLRDVDAKSLQGAFADAFKENEIKADQEPVKLFLDAVRAGGGAKEKKSIVIAGEKTAEGESVIYEDSEGKVSVTKGGPGFIRQVFALWLAKPVDSGVESFQKDLLGR